MRAMRAPMTVHVWNALIAACERAGQFERALEMYREMVRAGVEPNNVTQSLMSGVGQKGVEAVDSQQAAIAALSAAVAAAGTVLMRSGIF